MPENDAPQLSTEGPNGAPPGFLGRTARSLLGVAALVLVAVVIAVAASVLPSGTDAGSLIARGALGLGIGLVLIVVVRRMLKALASPPPPPPLTIDARPADVVYECATCGTRVRLEVASTAKPPRHCGEDMEARVS